MWDCVPSFGLLDIPFIMIFLFPYVGFWARKVRKYIPGEGYTFYSLMWDFRELERLGMLKRPPRCPSFLFPYVGL